MLYGVILAAGKSKRFGKNKKKQFLLINKKPIFIYSVDKFLSLKKIDKIILVIDKNDKDNKLIKKFFKDYESYITRGKITIIIGGNERYDSVYNALTYISSSYGISNKDKILIHDSARPNVNVEDIDELIKLLNKYKAISLGSRLKDTIKEIKSITNNIADIKNTKDRNKYTLVSTPQGFDLKTLLKSYNIFNKVKNKSRFTDDLQIVEEYSKVKSYILITNNNNLKITTQNDLNMIKYLLSN